MWMKTYLCVYIGNKINSNKAIYVWKIEEMAVYFIDTYKILFHRLIFLFQKQVKQIIICILNHYISKSQLKEWID